MTGGDQSLLVAFDAPPADGGLPVISYVVKIEPGDKEIQVKALPFSPCRIIGLRGGMKYTAEVAAVNGKGRSSWSRPSRPVTSQGARQSGSW